MIGKEERDAVIRVIESGCLSGYQGNWSDAFYGGNEIKALESEWATHFGVKHAIACNSATSGLWMACSAIGLKPGDECICSPYTMTCSASMPLHFKAVPVFADIERDFFCIDPVSVEKNITEKTRAIIAVDIFGLPYDADAINAIAEKYSKIYGHKIYVIEDAAQAIGATHKGRYAGTLGDIGVYSLNRHKHIHCGEGGVVVTNDDDLAMKLRLLMNHSEAVINDYNRKINEVSTEEYLKNFERDYNKIFAHNNIGLVGMNLRMPELSAAVAREQLKKLDGILKVYREYAKYFPVKVRPNCEHAFYRYALAHCGVGTAWPNGTKWFEQLFATKNHYITPLFKLPLFRSLGYDQNQCPVCQDVESKIVLTWLKEVP